MKTIMFAVILALAPLVKAAQEADYVVPHPAELEQYANFKVQVVKAYIGDATDTLAYTFPAELTGNPPLTVTLKRVAGTENSWESLEMSAECNETGDLFSCDIYLNKKPAENKVVNLGSVFSGNMVMQDAQATGNDTFINKKSAEDFIEATSISPMMLQGKKFILGTFLSSEPAGTLSYRFTTVYPK